MGRSASSSGCPKQLLCVPRSHFPNATFSAPCLPRPRSLQCQWGHFQRERPVAQLTHMLVPNEAGVVVRSLPGGAALVMMGMLPMVGMVRTARHHMPDLVHDFQPHHQRPCGQKRERRNAGRRGNVLGTNHGKPKLAWVGGIWSAWSLNCGTLRHGLRHDAKTKFKQHNDCQSVALTFLTRFEGVKRHHPFASPPRELLAFLVFLVEVKFGDGRKARPWFGQQFTRGRRADARRVAGRRGPCHQNQKPHTQGGLKECVHVFVNVTMTVMLSEVHESRRNSPTLSFLRF